MGAIIGAHPSIATDGVVTFLMQRREPISPYLNVAAPIAFEPLGTDALCVADPNMIANEINPVIAKMRSPGWLTGWRCNQETDEHPPALGAWVRIHH